VAQTNLFSGVCADCGIRVGEGQGVVGFGARGTKLFCLDHAPAGFVPRQARHDRPQNRGNQARWDAMAPESRRTYIEQNGCPPFGVHP
jgi:hypothetical protein